MPEAFAAPVVADIIGSDFAAGVGGALGGTAADVAAGAAGALGISGGTAALGDPTAISAAGAAAAGAAETGASALPTATTALSGETATAVPAAQEAAAATTGTTATTPAQMLSQGGSDWATGANTAMTSNTGTATGNGLIDKALNFANNNTGVATLGAGALAGLGKGAGTYLAAQQQAKMQKELMDKRAAIIAANAYTGNVGVTPNTTPGGQILKRPDGTAVFVPGSGIIANQLRQGG